MNTPLMMNAHQDTASPRAPAVPWLWTLGRHRASTLAAAPLARWLQVQAGRVWLTRANGREPASDIWLQAGDSLALPAGSEWVVEGWPQAHVTVAQQAPGTNATSATV